MVSANICRSSLRGVGNRPPENSWFPLWLLNRYFSFSWDEQPDFLFYGDLPTGELYKYPSKTIRVFLTGENIQPDWNVADYALTHERVWNERHWRAPLWRQFYDPGHTQLHRDFDQVTMRVNRFCNFIYSNETAKERIQFFQLLSQYKKVDSGGKVLNNLGHRVEDKLGMLAESKFTIAFENESHPGYATEKIIQPLIQGSIPIYWGDPFIAQDFNPECFINVHDYASFEDVIEEVIRIDNDDKLWKAYLTAPIFLGGRIPDDLSDSAYVSFFQSIFSSKKAYVSPIQKSCQYFDFQFSGCMDRSLTHLQKCMGRMKHEIRKYSR